MEEILGENILTYRVLFTWRDGLSKIYTYPRAIKGIFRKIKEEVERPISFEFIDEISDPNILKSVTKLELIGKWETDCTRALTKKKEEMKETHEICNYCNRDIIQVYDVQHKNHYLVCSGCNKLSEGIKMKEPETQTPQYKEALARHQAIPRCPLCNNHLILIGPPNRHVCDICSWQEKLDLKESIQTETPKAKTDKVGTGLLLIPLYSLLALGKIFIEGLRYGRDNWKKGVHDKEYQEERLEHALLHLIKYKEGDRSEPHLAKVAWFCFTQLELERLEQLSLPEKECPEKEDHCFIAQPLGWDLIKVNMSNPKVRLNLERLRDIYKVEPAMNNLNLCDMFSSWEMVPFDISS